MSVRDVEQSSATGGSRYPVATAGLVATAALPVTVILRPAGLPEAWPLLTLLVVGLAAHRGATRPIDPAQRAGRQPAVRHGLRMGGWTLAAAAADVVWRAVLGFLTAGALPATLVDGATLGLVGVTVIGVYVGGSLATRMSQTASAHSGGQVARPVGVGLVGGAILALGAAGWTAAEPAATAWPHALGAVGCAAYVALALGQIVRLRRHGLNARWQASGRTVDAAVVTRWPVWTALVALITGFAFAVWWLPGATRLRGGFHILAWLRGVQEPPERDAIDGPTFGWWWPEQSADPTGPSAMVILAVATTVALVVAVLAIRGARRYRQHLSLYMLKHRLRRVGQLLMTLLSVLRVMLRPRKTSPQTTGADASTVAVRLPASLRQRLRRWRRPSDPRAQVIHDYQRTLHHAARHGLQRPLGQPALHFADILRAHLPEHSDHVDELTTLFNEARYSHHHVGTGAAARAKHAGRQLRTALRRTSPTPAEPGQST